MAAPPDAAVAAALDVLPSQLLALFTSHEAYVGQLIEVLADTEAGLHYGVTVRLRHALAAAPGLALLLAARPRDALDTMQHALLAAQARLVRAGPPPPDLCAAAGGGLHPPSGDPRLALALALRARWSVKPNVHPRVADM